MTLFGGLLRLATFRPEGFAGFAATRQAFLNSLAPLLAFPLAGVLLAVAQGVDVGEAASALLGTVVALLTPAVVSHALARRWGRDEAWLRYAVAFNWCQWAVPATALLALLVAGVLVTLRVPLRAVAVMILLGLLTYGVALHIFLARRGLGLGPWRAVGLVLATNIATFALAVLPRVILTGGSLTEVP